MKEYETIYSLILINWVFNDEHNIDTNCLLLIANNGNLKLFEIKVMYSKVTYKTMFTHQYYSPEI